MDISGILIGMALCAFSALLLSQRIQWRSSAQRSENWIATRATVLSSEVEQRSCDLAELFEPNITYRYSVNGQIFTNSNISFELPTFSESRARRLVERYRPGGEISIRYDPANPGRAMLEWARPYPPIGALEVSTAVLGLGILIYELHQNGFGSALL